MPYRFLIFVILLTACASEQEPKKMVQEEKSVGEFGTDDYEYRTYYLGFLNRGEQRDQDSAAVMELQKTHLAYMSKLANEGKLVIAGPFLDDWNTRGIVIYAVDSLDEAKALANADPAVKAGRLEVEVHPWMSARGSTLP